MYVLLFSACSSVALTGYTSYLATFIADSTRNSQSQTFSPAPPAFLRLAKAVCTPVKASCPPAPSTRCTTNFPTGLNKLGRHRPCNFYFSSSSLSYTYAAGIK